MRCLVCFVCSTSRLQDDCVRLRLHSRLHWSRVAGQLAGGGRADCHPPPPPPFATFHRPRTFLPNVLPTARVPFHGQDALPHGQPGARLPSLKSQAISTRSLVANSPGGFAALLLWPSRFTVPHHQATIPASAAAARSWTARHRMALHDLPRRRVCRDEVTKDPFPGHGRRNGLLQPPRSGAH